MSGRLKPLPLVAGLALFAWPLVLDSELSHWGEHGARPALAAALTLLMATWWITEAVPITRITWSAIRRCSPHCCIAAAIPMPPRNRKM